MIKQQKFFLLGLALVAGYILFYILPINYRDLWQPDETRYAEISREMLLSGNWIVPHFFDLRYFEKPVMGYWINNIGQWLFGHNNFAVRAGSIFSTSLTALLVAWLTFTIWRDKRTTLYALIIFLTSFIVYGVGTYAVLDPILSLWLTAAMCCLWYAMQANTVAGKATGFVLLGIACGLGVMTKGFLALAVPVISILPWLFCNTAISEKRWRDLLIYGGLAVIFAILITLPWALAIARQEADFWHYFFWTEHIQRFFQQDAQHKAPFWYYLPVVLAGSLPWLGLLPGALRLGWQGRRHCQHAFYLLCWVVMPILLFSIAKGKLLTYILPCFAPLAILMARYISQTQRGFRLNGWLNVLFAMVAILIVWLILSPWGLGHKPIYQRWEWLATGSAILAFAIWLFFGLFSLYKPQRHWWLAALCPLGVALLIGLAIPEQSRDSKQPQHFLRHNHQLLANSRYILANDPGVASAIAWQLKRSNIMLFANQGELRYGLSYADAQGKFVSNEDLAPWLQQHRQQGAVSLVLRCPYQQTSLCLRNLPVPDILYYRGRFMFLHFLPTTTLPAPPLPAPPVSLPSAEVSSGASPAVNPANPPSARVR